MGNEELKMIVKMYEQRIDSLSKENEYLRKQVEHLQASIDAEMEG